MEKEKREREEEKKENKVNLTGERELFRYSFPVEGRVEEILLKTLEVEPQVAVSIVESEEALMTSLKKRMKGLLQEQGLKEIEVVRARGTPAGYKVRYRLKIRFRGGGRGVKNVEEAVEKAPWVRTTKTRPLKEGEICSLF